MFGLLSTKFFGEVKGESLPLDQSVAWEGRGNLVDAAGPLAVTSLPMSRTRLLPYLVVLVLLGACSRDDEFTRPDPPADGEALSVTAGGPQTPVVATFAGLPVSQADLDLLQNTGYDAETLTRFVALRRKLAAMALEQGLGDRASVRMAWYQGLARAWIQQKFEIEHTPDSVPMERWEKLYNDRRVRPMFDHKDTYFVRDAQITCCSEPGFACRKATKYEQCFSESMPKIQEAYTQLMLMGPSTAAEFEKAVSNVARQIRGLGLQKYSFQYDYSKSFEMQRGYNVVDENVAKGARETGVGGISSPIRSAFGWHVLYVEKFMPEVSLPFGHPNVMDTLRREFHGFMRDEDVLRNISETIKKYGIRVDADLLRSVDWMKHSGLRP